MLVERGHNHRLTSLNVVGTDGKDIVPFTLNNKRGFGSLYICFASSTVLTFW